MFKNIINSAFLFILLLATQDILTGQDLEILSSEAVVTASRIPQESYKTGRSIEIITQSDLQEYPIQSVDEILRYLSGVNTNIRAPFGVQNDIGIRGSTYTQVLILIDNVRFNDPLTGHFNSNIPISKSEIDHIEVIKGPAAVAYGSDAVGGLIHIKTKLYVAQEESRYLESTVDVSFGENNLLTSDVAVIMKKSKWLLSGSQMTRLANGPEYINPNFLSGTSSDSLYNSDFDLRTYGVSLGYLFTPRTKVLLRAGYDYRDFNAKYFYTNSVFDESRETITNGWGTGTLIQTLGKHRMEVNLSIKSVDDFFEFNPQFTPNTHNTQQHIGQYSHIYTHDPKTTIGFGAQVIDKRIDSSDRGNHVNLNSGIYVLGSRQFGNEIFLNLGARLESDANFGTEFLPQVSLSWKKNITVLRGSYGKSIRAADFTERFVSSLIPNLSPGRNIGNPDLLAEVSHSYDIGADIYLESGVNLSATGFYRESQNLIDFSLRNESTITNVSNLQEGEDYFYADNVSESNVLGLELTANKKWKFWTRGFFDANLAYTLMRTEAEAGDLSKYISNHPTSNFSSVLNLGIYKLNFILASNYIKRNPEFAEGIGRIDESYWVSNFKWGYSPTPSIKLYFQIYNVANVSHQEVLGAVLPGRWVSFGFVYDVINEDF